MTPRPPKPPAPSLEEERAIHPTLRASTPLPGTPAAALRRPGQLVETAPKPPSVLLAPFMLLFTPARFWHHFANVGRPNTTVTWALLIGMALTIDRMEIKVATGQLPGVVNWFTYWALVIVVGMLGGFLNYWIRGWWYKVRLSFCGVQSPDPALARHVFVTSGLIIAIPMIAYSLVMTVLHPDPLTALNHSYPFDWALLTFPFWSAIISYNGVRTVFGARAGAALAWFLILPSLVFGAVVGMAAVAILLLNGAMPADIDHPVAQDEGAVRFEYPGNWVLDDWSYDADSIVTVTPWLQDAYYSVIVHEDSSATAEQILDAAIEAYEREAPLASVVSEDEPTLVGVYHGIATTVESGLGNERERFTCFVHQFEPGRYLEIQRSCYGLREKAVSPGFELIDRTLVVVY